jgi:hypothetical protein
MHMGMIEWYAFYSKNPSLKALVSFCVVSGDVLLLADRLRLFLNGMTSFRQIESLLFIHGNDINFSAYPLMLNSISCIGDYLNSKELTTTFVFAGLETVGMTYACIRNLSVVWAPKRSWH